MALGDIKGIYSPAGSLGCCLRGWGLGGIFRGSEIPGKKMTVSALSLAPTTCLDPSPQHFQMCLHKMHMYTQVRIDARASEHVFTDRSPHTHLQKHTPIYTYTKVCAHTDTYTDVRSQEERNLHRGVHTNAMSLSTWLHCHSCAPLSRTTHHGRNGIQLYLPWSCTHASEGASAPRYQG